MEETVEFYDVKTRAKVQVPISDVTKKTYSSETRADRHGLRGKYDGRVLTKFVSKANYDALNVPVEP